MVFTGSLPFGEAVVCRVLQEANGLAITSLCAAKDQHGEISSSVNCPSDDEGKSRDEYSGENVNKKTTMDYGEAASSDEKQREVHPLA